MEGKYNNFSNEVSLTNIKSKLILKTIFSFLNQKSYLKIINYNKALKNRLNKNIYDYKKESYKIEIEIFRKKFNYGKFINVIKKHMKDIAIYIFIITTI